MSDVVLGVPPGKYSERDAIHIAVIPMIADEDLHPGCRIKISEPGHAIKGEPAIGIVDPYLDGRVSKGKRFWLCLFQNTVQGMRHHWSHPAFDDPTGFKASEKWLREYADKVNYYTEDSERRFADLCEGLKSDDLHFDGTDLHGIHDLDDAEDLKYHAEIYLGVKIDFGRFTFSCSC